MHHRKKLSCFLNFEILAFLHLQNFSQRCGPPEANSDSTEQKNIAPLLLLQCLISARGGSEENKLEFDNKQAHGENLLAQVIGPFYIKDCATRENFSCLELKIEP